MTLLWLAMAFLLLVLLVLTLSPWLFPKRDVESEQKEINIELTRHRLEELDREEGQGLLSEQSRQEAEQEIKLALVHESEVEVSKGELHRGLMIGLTLIAIAVTGYSYWSSSKLEAVENWQNAVKRLPELGKRAVLQADNSITPKDLQDFALGLRTQLVKKPKDAVGWLLLGRVYMSSQQLESAIQAFEKSLELEPQRKGTLISYSQALLMTGDENNIRHGIQLLTRVVMQEPDSRDALGLLAIAATQLGEAELAKKSWSQLLTLLEPTDPMYAEVENRIQQLSSSDLRIPIEVVVGPGVMASLPERGTLFVFAQDADSDNKMPAAVVKMPLSQWPVKTALSDANAMMPGYRLSQLKRVRLVARVSKDENVQAAPGELEGDIVLELNSGVNSNQTIVLNKEVM